MKITDLIAGITVVAVAIALIGCKMPKDEKEIQTIVDNQSSIQDIWEYTHPTGTCTAGQYGGDSPNGCIVKAQLVRYADGSAYFSLNIQGGATVGWGWEGYIAPNSTTYDEYLFIGSPIRMKILGDLSLTTPTMEYTYDTNGNYDDTAKFAVPFTQVSY